MIVTLALTGLIAAFMQTLVTPIIPELPIFLHATSADATWVLTATLLAAAVSTPISGRLGDMYGKRRIMLVLLIIMVAGSIVCAISFSLVPMIIGRALQGFGLGTIALGISILRDVLHPRNLGGAVALVSATLGVGGAVGLPLAAVIAQNFDYHYLFWLAVLLGLVAIFFVAYIIPVSTLRSGGTFDFVGAGGFAIGLVALLLAVAKGGAWGWGSPLTVGLLVGAVVVLGLWGIFELRQKDALVDLRVAARRPVLLTNLASICVGFAFFVISATAPIILEGPRPSGIGLGNNLVLASLCLVPLGLVMFIMSPVAARLSAARGPRTSLILGLVVILAAFVTAIFLHSELWHIILLSTIVGLGVGFAYASMPTLIMRAVPPTETAAANGLNAVMRTLGSTVSATIAGLIFSTHVSLIAGTPVPTTEAFRLVFVIAAAVTLAGIVLGILIPRRGRAYGDTASIPVQQA
jgi:MFS family permease